MSRTPLALLEADRSIRARFELTPIASSASRWLTLRNEARTVALLPLRLRTDAYRSARMSSTTRHGPRAPLATVVIGGIVSSTALTLVILPALYAWVHGDRATRTDAGQRECGSVSA